MAVPNAETNIFALLPVASQTNNARKPTLIIWENTMEKEIRTFESESEVVNCFFAREWFVVAEKRRVVIYDQKRGFQKLLIFDNMHYTQAAMKYSDGSFFFAFADRLNCELNILYLFGSEGYSCNTSPVKEKRGLVAFSSDLKYCAYTTTDTKLLKVFDATNLKRVVCETKLGPAEPAAIYIINEHIVLIYYNSNCFELRDLSKVVKSYFIFSGPLLFKFAMTEPLCLYEHNAHTRPVVDFDINYYDKTSVRSVDIVGL